MLIEMADLQNKANKAAKALSTTTEYTNASLEFTYQGQGLSEEE